MATSIGEAAAEWVKDRRFAEAALRTRVAEAMGNALDNGYFEDEWAEDAEAWAEDLACYASDLETVPVVVLAQLVQEYMDRRREV